MIGAGQALAKGSDEDRNIDRLSILLLPGGLFRSTAGTYVFQADEERQPGRRTIRMQISKRQEYNHYVAATTEKKLVLDRLLSHKLDVRCIRSETTI